MLFLSALSFSLKALLILLRGSLKKINELLVLYQEVNRRYGRNRSNKYTKEKIK
jgi:HEPN domain-containing protein